MVFCSDMIDFKFRPGLIDARMEKSKVEVALDSNVFCDATRFLSRWRNQDILSIEA